MHCNGFHYTWINGTYEHTRHKLRNTAERVRPFTKLIHSSSEIMILISLLFINCLRKTNTNSLIHSCPFFIMKLISVEFVFDYRCHFAIVWQTVTVDENRTEVGDWERENAYKIEKKRIMNMNTLNSIKMHNKSFRWFNHDEITWPPCKRILYHIIVEPNGKKRKMCENKTKKKQPYQQWKQKRLL